MLIENSLGLHGSTAGWTAAGWRQFWNLAADEQDRIRDRWADDDWRRQSAQHEQLMDGCYPADVVADWQEARAQRDRDYAELEQQTDAAAQAAEADEARWLALSDAERAAAAKSWADAIDAEGAEAASGFRALPPAAKAEAIRRERLHQLRTADSLAVTCETMRQRAASLRLALVRDGSIARHDRPLWMALAGVSAADALAEAEKAEADWQRRRLLDGIRNAGSGLAAATSLDDAREEAKRILALTGPERPAVAIAAPGLLSVDAVEALPDPEWLVEGLIQERTLAIAYGPPKHGKTFVALSLALHVAAGRGWFGRQVHQGGVVYIAGEGAGGLKLRIRAARKRYGLPADIPFWVLPHAVNFTDPKAVEELIALIERETAGQAVSLVIIDTLARAMPGADENSAGEVGQVIARCDRLKERLGCTVMPIHHQGKEGAKGMRGSSALDGAVDTLLQVTRDRSVPGADVVTLATVYQKDAEEAAPILFDLMAVEATEGRSSLVPVLRLDAAPKVEKLTPQQQAALFELSAMLAEAEADAVAESAWRKRCVDGRSVSAGDNEKARKQAFKSAAEALARRGRIEIQGEMVRLLPAERQSPAESGQSLPDSATAPPRAAAAEAECV